MQRCILAVQSILLLKCCSPSHSGHSCCLTHIQPSDRALVVSSLCGRVTDSHFSPSLGVQASDRLFYFYQTLLDCHSALEQLGSEAEQAQAEARQHLQVTLAPFVELLAAELQAAELQSLQQLAVPCILCVQQCAWLQH